MGWAITVINTHDRKPYVVSTTKNPWGIWESAVFQRGFLGLPGKPVCCVCPILPHQMSRLDPRDMIDPERRLGKRIVFIPVTEIPEPEVKEVHAIVAEVAQTSPPESWKGLFLKAVYDFLKARNLIPETRPRSPIAELSHVIFIRSFECADALKPFIHERFGEKSQEASYKWVYVLYEFTYFFMHLTNRIIFGKKGLGEEKGAKLQRELANLAVGPTVEAVFGDAPDDLKARMKDEFYENLNRSEEEYTNCVELLSGSNEKAFVQVIAEGGTRRGLINQLADNIARTINRDLDVVVLMRVKDVAFAASQSMNLVELVQAAGKEL